MLTFAGSLDFLPLVSTTVAMWIAAGASAVIAFANLLDLAFDFDGSARTHTRLYERFKELQERMAREIHQAPDKMHEWEADAQAIRRDEPPTMWAIYAVCWNQTIEHHVLNKKDYARTIGRGYWLLRHFFEFRPNNFPTAS